MPVDTTILHIPPVYVSGTSILPVSLLTLKILLVLILFIYALIPNLPFSGMLLDMNENLYVNQLFGENSYFQDGFTYLISIIFLLTGIAYAIGAKTIKNDKELVEKSSDYLKDVGYLVVLIFVAAQFIAVFKKTNIGTIIVATLLCNETNFVSRNQVS